MKILIIEDEPLAAERLADLIQQYNKNYEILQCLDCIRDAVDWFNQYSTPDLCFMDIQLADGLSFDIFEQAIVDCPIIFTTAFDEYALKAFKVNSIDYLLKPIDLDDLTKAFEKYFQLTETNQQSTKGVDLSVIQNVMQMMTKQYKKRFMVKAGHHLTAVPVEDILYLYSEHRTTWIKTKSLKKHAIDYTLEQLEGLLDPHSFFRLNRKFITTFPAIKDVVSFTNSRLKVKLLDNDDKDMILISREKASAFKAWLDQ